LKKILIVDSDQQVTAILELKLKQSNFDVKILSRTVNAIKTVKEYAPDLIISEMVLPELSGVDFLKRVKMNPETSKIPFMFLSSSRNIEDKILAHEMGAEAFFMKPIFIKVLIQRIKDFFDQAGFNEMLALSSESAEFKGDLASISIIDILNIISENRSTGKISFISSTGDKAFIFFTNGSVIRIETEGSLNRNGEEELFKLLSWLDGTFVMSYGDINVQRNVRIPHDSLIVKSVNWLDDYTGELSEMPPLDTKLHLDFAKFMSDINKFPDKISCIIRNIGADGSRLSDIIDRTELDRKQTVSYLKKLLEQDIVSVEKKETEFALPKKPEWLVPKESGQAEEKKSDEIEDVLNNLSFEKTASPKSDDRNIEKTIVPPPDFIQKDTIDPAVGISLQNIQEEEPGQITEVPKPGLLDSISLNFGNFDEEPQPVIDANEEDEIDFDKTMKSIIEEEAPSNNEPEEKSEDNLKTILDDHFADLNDAPKGKYAVYPGDSNESKTGVKFVTVILFLFFIVFSAVGFGYYFYPDKINDYFSLLAEFFETESAQSPEVGLIPESDAVIDDSSSKEIVLSEKQKELLDNSVESLIDKAASFYENEKIEEAVEINMTALYKMKKEDMPKDSVYEKVVTNMAIYYYMLDKGEEALKYATESMELREDSKSIELKVAILDFLGRKSEAASILRSKLNDSRYEEKSDAWIREINRLEKLE